MTKDWKSVLVSPETPIIDTLKVIDSGAMQIALVVDAEGRLLGTVTDGDVRRAILGRVPLDARVSRIMNGEPRTARSGDGEAEIIRVMRDEKRRQVPVLDDEGRVVGLEILDDLLRGGERPNWVVLMAGGQGSRLQPLTDDCPKPLLKVGDKPILETILEAFVGFGFRRFFISLGYKAEMFERHFGDGSRWDAEIEYLREPRQLGTAGSLSLLRERPAHPLFVMNGDLLTKVNFLQLLDFHRQQAAAATMCVREHELQVPFGVVEIEGDRVVAIDETPLQRVFVNAGIYVLEPDVLDRVPAGRSDMPALIRRLADEPRGTAVFPVREYWMDIGRIDDYRRANGDFAEVFKE